MFEDFKNSLLTFNLNNYKKSKKNEECFINPFSVLEENGLTGKEIIMQSHTSCLLLWADDKNIPALIRIVNRTDHFSEEKELFILKELNGEKHIVQLNQYFIKHHYEIFILISGFDFISKSLTLGNLRFFLRGVLEALKDAHKIDIIHLDIRLDNILVSKNIDNVYLINWDYATKINNKMSCTVGSRSIRSPEMLIFGLLVFLSFISFLMEEFLGNLMIQKKL